MTMAPSKGSAAWGNCTDPPAGEVAHRRYAERGRRAARNLSARPEPPRSLPADHQIVAVDHLGPAGKAKDRVDIAGGSAAYFLRVLGVIGAQAAPDLDAAGTADDHGVAAGEAAFDPHHSDR